MHNLAIRICELLVAGFIATTTYWVVVVFISIRADRKNGCRAVHPTHKTISVKQLNAIPTLQFIDYETEGWF